MHVEADLVRALERLPRDTVGAPVNVIEQAPVGVLDAEKVVAAVGGGTEHGAVARPPQHFRGLHQECSRQSRAVGIEHDGRRVTGCEQAVDRLEQAIAEIGQPGFDQADLARQIVDEELLRARRPVGHVAVNGGATARGQEVCGHVLEEGGVEGGGFGCRKRRRQARLGAAWNGSLRHHGDTAGAMVPDARHRVESIRSSHGLSVHHSPNAPYQLWFKGN